MNAGVYSFLGLLKENIYNDHLHVHMLRAGSAKIGRVPSVH